MNGLLDFIKTPEGQGLLSATFGGLAGARRGTPVNNIGKAGLAGLLGYSNAQDQQGQMADKAFKALQQQRQQQEWAKSDKIDALAPQFLSQGAGGATNLVNDALPPEMRMGALPALPNAKPAGFDAQGYVNAMMAIDPAKALAFQQSMAKDSMFGKVDAKDYTPESVAKFAQTRSFGDLVPRSKAEVAPNGMVFDPYNVKPGTVFADPNKPFSAGANGAVIPNTPFQQFDITKAAAGAARNSNTVINKQETEEAKTVGKFFGDAYGKTQESGTNAQGSLNRFNRLGQLLEGVDTGKFTPLGVEVAKGAQAFGFKVDPDLSNKEAALALSSEMALQLRNPSGGAGMPGAMSDADRNFLAGMVPGIEKTPEGRKLIIETGQKMAKREIKVSEIARDYRKKNGSIDEGFYDELAKYSEANPLFKEPTAKPSATAARAFDSKPPAQQYKGKSMTGPDGKRYTSDGMMWKEVK